jgi:AraC family transcriptional regulator
MDLLNPTLQSSKPLLIAGLQSHFTPATRPDIPKLWQRFVPHLGKIPTEVGFIAYGVVLDTNQSGFEYMAGVEITNASHLPAGFATISLPAQKYFAFPHDGHISEIPQLTAAIMRDWIPLHHAEITNFPAMLEIYGADFSPQTGRGGIELCLPAK